MPDAIGHMGTPASSAARRKARATRAGKSADSETIRSKTVVAALCPDERALSHARNCVA